MATIQAELKRYFDLRIEAAKDRARKLKELNAPEVIIKNEEKLTSPDYWDGIIAGMIKKSEISADQPISGHACKKGKGGQPYIVFSTPNDLDIFFFPCGKYGPFMKWGEA